jgi:hypothetical protein
MVPIVDGFQNADELQNWKSGSSQDGSTLAALPTA